MDMNALLAKAPIKSTSSRPAHGAPGNSTGEVPKSEKPFAQNLKSAIQAATGSPSRSTMLPGQLPVIETAVEGISSHDNLRALLAGHTSAQDNEQLPKTELEELVQDDPDLLAPSALTTISNLVPSNTAATDTHKPQAILASTPPMGNGQQQTALPSTPETSPDNVRGLGTPDIAYHTRALPQGTNLEPAANGELNSLQESVTGKPSLPETFTTRIFTGDGHNSQSLTHQPNPSPIVTSAFTGSAGPIARSAAGSGLALTTPLGSEVWGQEFSQHLLTMAHRGDKQVDLHLHPRELGSLTVSLNLDDQGVRAQFLTANAAVRSAVEQAIPQLRETLAQQGIALGETSVGQQQQQTPQQQHSGRDLGESSAIPNEFSSADKSNDEKQTVVHTALGSRASGIDLYA